MKSQRNSLAGKHPSYDKLKMSEARRKKKLAYDKEYQATPSRVKYREALNTANRKAKTYGNKDGKDMSHTKSGKMVSESQKTNRARNGHNGKSTKK
jgi:hypothetical protein